MGEGADTEPALPALRRLFAQSFGIPTFSNDRNWLVSKLKGRAPACAAAEEPAEEPPSPPARRPAGRAAAPQRPPRDAPRAAPLSPRPRKRPAWLCDDEERGPGSRGRAKPAARRAAAPPQRKAAAAALSLALACEGEGGGDGRDGCVGWSPHRGVRPETPASPPPCPKGVPPVTALERVALSDGGCLAPGDSVYVLTAAGHAAEASCAHCCVPADCDQLLECDRCLRGFHLPCVGLGSIPDGCWACPGCSALSPHPRLPCVTDIARVDCGHLLLARCEAIWWDDRGATSSCDCLSPTQILTLFCPLLFPTFSAKAVFFTARWYDTPPASARWWVPGCECPLREVCLGPAAESGAQPLGAVLRRAVVVPPQHARRAARSCAAAGGQPPLVCARGWDDSDDDEPALRRRGGWRG